MIAINVNFFKRPFQKTARSRDTNQTKEVAVKQAQRPERESC